MALTVGGAILVFGANDKGQLGTGDTLDRWKPTRINLYSPWEDTACLRVVQLACGQEHSIALFSVHGVLQVRRLFGPSCCTTPIHTAVFLYLAIHAIT